MTCQVEKCQKATGFRPTLKHARGQIKLFLKQNKPDMRGFNPNDKYN